MPVRLSGTCKIHKNGPSVRKLDLFDWVKIFIQVPDINFTTLDREHEKYYFTFFSSFSIKQLYYWRLCPDSGIVHKLSIFFKKSTFRNYFDLVVKSLNMKNNSSAICLFIESLFFVFRLWRYCTSAPIWHYWQFS